MLIKPIEDNLYDIFLGNGWLNWVRVAVKENPPRVTVIKKADHMLMTEKLTDVLYYKIKRYQRN